MGTAMKVFIINGHHPYPFSKGRLNATLVTRARELLYLTRPRKRQMRGRTTPLVPSRFLEGLPEDLQGFVDPGFVAGLQ